MTLKKSCNRNHDQKDNTSPPSPKHHDSKHQVDLFQALIHLLRLLDSLTLARLALTSKYKDEDDSDGHKDDICINNPISLQAAVPSLLVSSPVDKCRLTRSGEISHEAHQSSKSSQLECVPRNHIYEVYHVTTYI